MKTIGAVFETEDQVRMAYGRLQEAGVSGDERCRSILRLAGGREYQAT